MLIIKHRNWMILAAGLLLLFWALGRTYHAPGRRHPPARAASWVQIMVLAVLIVYPLGIPTSWTRANIIEKRQEVLDENAWLSVPIYSARA